MNHVQGAWNTLSGNESAVAALPIGDGGDGAFKFLDLSKTQRMYAFGICFVGGFACSIVGSIFFAFGQISLFALLYVLGVVISLIGTGFLVGFKKQLKSMLDPVRIYAALLFLTCIALVFVFAFAVRIDILVIVFAVCTYLTYAWYILSYIPFARAFVSKIFSAFV